MADDVTQEIKSRLLLSTIVGRRTKIMRKGRADFMALCPFHGEKTPSFHVMDDKGAYYCFGCGEKGDIFTFVQKTENLGFREALEKLAAEAGVALPAPNPEAKQQAERRQTLHDVLEAACAWYEAQLRTGAGAAARGYFTRRGLTAETVARFRLGFAPAGSTGLKDAMIARGFSPDLLVEAGLVRQPDDGRAPYDYFRDRVTFPIRDARGRVIAFGARTMGDAEPKYLNSPETPLFHKGDTLFNLNLAREAAHRQGRAVVCEGYMDVIALDQAGIAEAVAPLGTALTEGQLEALWRLAPEPILCFDGDKAGQRAASRALDRALALLKPGHSLRFLTLPDNLDPDELIRRDGVAAMRGQLDKAQPLVDFLWQRERAAADFSTPERRAAFETRVGAVVREIADQRLQLHYREEFRGRVRLLMDELRPKRPAWSPRPPRGPGGRGFPPFAPQGASQHLRANPLAQGQNTGAGSNEGLLLLILARHPRLLPRVEDDLARLEFTAPGLDSLRSELLSMSFDAEGLDSDKVKGHLADVGLAETIARLENDAFLRLHEAARDDVTLDVVEEQWRQVLAFHSRQTGLRADLSDAKADYEASPTEAGLRRIQAIEKELTRIESQVPGTGADGGFSA
ncbi:DNA primase [Zavarzinia compransoris]|uniref:DNA primase n=1 Tax=Zavarzinia compransoris TaxID=1264899 RepID=A0A317E065_9PROT|nr:DNA primase [Zavarzinia compransoris]PWR20032.1 DNA primase [Zavarzinia compransoris]TDP44848.1 DNA primase [Zavarzinia compransoris]